MFPALDDALTTIWAAQGGSPHWPAQLRVQGKGDLPSAFAVSDLAGASVGAACVAMAEFIQTRGAGDAIPLVDRRLASFWFGWSIHPQDWRLEPPQDGVTGDYATTDGWIRLHANAPHHRDAALAVLGTSAERVADAVRGWSGEALETAIVARGGCAAEMRSAGSWTAHPQGRAVASDPLVIRAPGGPAASPHWAVPTARPLQGVRVLDMTRVLAGPVATRFLAGFGAEVLRIDPPSWNEPGVVPDVTLGKRCARLDLRRAEDRTVWEGLLRRADVLVHGYRPGALDGLGLDAERRSTLCPGLVDVSLDAYGWSGPWRGRRGFDSLVQMSSGIAEAGMRHFGRDRPTPLPVQALDHATGYIIATAVIRGLTERLANGTGCTTRVSLARTAALLASLSPGAPVPMPPVTQDDLQEAVEQTDWGPARRLRPPGAIEGTPMRWDRPASDLGSASPAWIA